MESSNGKILGFIGPIGGGKTFQLEIARQNSQSEQRKFITGDFSDGIRVSVLKIFGVEDKGAVLEPSDENYLEWKQIQDVIMFPTERCQLEELRFKYRDLLKNVGEYFKKLAGEDVWARWTGNDICRKYYELPESERDRCNVAFGSVRFGVEVAMVFNIAKIINKEVQLIFCNYHGVEYNPNVHISELLAHQLIFRGYDDGADVTEAVKEIYKIQ